MPSTRISICLICAWDIGANVQLRSSNSRSFVFIVPPLLEKMHSKLLRDSETDMATNGHERLVGRVSTVPIHAKPDVHSGSQAYVSRDSGQQHITAASVLVNSRYAVVLTVEPGQYRTDEPFSRHVFCLIRTV